ncbi:MAG: V-type ATP synthase subunit E [Candidatus Syntrophosphaera sp.]|nr:V-type ATP synthase subunit E [Candidatus Syntrophosphaera sp.]
MTDKLQDLLKRVYDEGVDKAKTEAEAILEQANSEAEKIVAQAKAEAEKTLSEAQKKAADLLKNNESDLKMAAQQTLSAVKQKLTDVFLDKAFDASLGKASGDPEFLKKVILETIAAWKESGGLITISENMKGKLEEQFLSSLKGTAEKGLKVEFSPQMKSGFSLAPADGGYKLSFTDEDFASLFKSYLRPRSNQLLFKN